MNDELRRDVNEILLKMYNGDLSAIDALYSKVSDRMFLVAMSFVHEKGAAEEVVQDSFLKIYRNIFMFRRHDNGYAWIMTIVRNVALNTIRKQKRQSALSLDDFYSLAAPEETHSDESGDLFNALKSLIKAEQQALWYRYYCDMTVRQVAVAMRLPKSTTVDLIKKAEMHVKEKLK